MPWRVDLKKRTTTSDAGVVVKFVRATETEWAGRVISGLENMKPSATDVARLMREAGDAWSRARRANR